MKCTYKDDTPVHIREVRSHRQREQCAPKISAAVCNNASMTHIHKLLASLRSAASRYHILAELKEALVCYPGAALRLAEGGSDDIQILIDVLMGANADDSEMALRILNEMRKAGCRQVLALRDCLSGVVRYINNTVVSNIASNIVVTLLCDSECGTEVASALVYEEDYLGFVEDVIRQQSGNAGNAFHILSLVLRKCDPKLIAMNEMRIVQLLQTMFFLDVFESHNYSLRCLRRVVSLSSKQLSIIITPAMIKFITCREPVTDTFLLLNEVLYRDNMCFLDSLYVIDWIIPKRKIDEFLCLVYQIIGNLTFVNEYCSYIFEKMYHEEILLDYGKLMFKAMDDFYIFFCRMTSFGTMYLISNPLFRLIFEEIIDFNESMPSIYLSVAFLQMISKIQLQSPESFIEILAEHNELNDILTLYSNSENEEIKALAHAILQSIKVLF